MWKSTTKTDKSLVFCIHIITGLRRVWKESLLSSSSPPEGPKRKKLELWEGYMVSGGSGTAVGFLSSMLSRELCIGCCDIINLIIYIVSGASLQKPCLGNKT